ncbi:B-cell differentiation antigen CD72 [Alligator mississippiensis]|uniref:B-cell differentiation antigen CD72 n=1 Tax=Alligator mississippiensis TaxID=8496 RepID=UPI002877837A|nr:B-cell differentiation antigen CD72 [Alligator mississippiensis]
MGESVTYADLRFSKAPPGWSAAPRAQRAAPRAPGEADGSYENLHLGAVGEGPAGSRAQQRREPLWRARSPPLGLLAACLALLVTTIALGVCCLHRLHCPYGWGWFGGRSEPREVLPCCSRSAQLEVPGPGPCTDGPAPTDWQQGQRLQQASHTHAAELHGLWQQVGTQEQRLGQAGAVLVQAQEELARTRAELAQAWQEGNHSQDELHRWDTELQETKVQLGQMQEQAWDLQQQLNKTESALASAWPCQVTGTPGRGRARQEVDTPRAGSASGQPFPAGSAGAGPRGEMVGTSPVSWPGSPRRSGCLCADCCPETWVLHRGKCLFLSKEKKTWKDSKKWCEQESAQLLILWDWDKMKMPSFLTTMDTLYWIGLRRDWKTMGRWTWIDGTEYSDGWTPITYASYGAIKGGSIRSELAWMEDELPWICEKADHPRGATKSNPGV